MLLTGYTREIFRPECNPSFQSVHCIAYLNEDVREVLECDLRLEHEAIPLLREAIAHCEQCGDYITRELLEDILEGEEEHVDWLETHLALFDKVGEQNFLQTMMDE